MRLLPNDFKVKHTDIPWAQIAGLRNRIVHDYFGLDLEIIWRVLQTSLRDLKSHLDSIELWRETYAYLEPDSFESPRSK